MGTFWSTLFGSYGCEPGVKSDPRIPSEANYLSKTAAMPAMLEAKETEEPPSRPPTISSSASQPGVPSSREYARRSEAKPECR